MIYRSNLFAPDFTAAFPYLTVRPMAHSYGHSVPSDWSDKRADDPVVGSSGSWGIYKNCGLLTHDEAAIVYNSARRHPGIWLDIGSHTGWSTAHLAGARDGHMQNCLVGIDPMYGVSEFRERAVKNLARAKTPAMLLNYTSRAFFESYPCGAMKFSGVMVDGDHTDGEPQLDARNALDHLKEGGVIVFHDFIGRPVREAVDYLISQGLKCRVYTTPHMMAVCWRGEFVPPEHQPDPKLEFLAGKCPEFDFARCA